MLSSKVSNSPPQVSNPTILPALKIIFLPPLASLFKGNLPDNNLPSPVNLLSLLVKVSLPGVFFCLLQAFS